MLQDKDKMYSTTLPGSEGSEKCYRYIPGTCLFGSSSVTKPENKLLPPTQNKTCVHLSVTGSNNSKRPLWTHSCLTTKWHWDADLRYNTIKQNSSSLTTCTPRLKTDLASSETVQQQCSFSFLLVVVEARNFTAFSKPKVDSMMQQTLTICRVHFVLILQKILDSTAMLVKCTLKWDNRGLGHQNDLSGIPLKW